MGTLILHKPVNVSEKRQTPDSWILLNLRAMLLDDKAEVGGHWEL